MIVNGQKLACGACIKGHRASSCKHFERQLVLVKKKGRPTTQCSKCRELRLKRSLHRRCNCRPEKDVELEIEKQNDLLEKLNTEKMQYLNGKKKNGSLRVIAPKQDMMGNLQCMLKMTEVDYYVHQLQGQNMLKTPPSIVDVDSINCGSNPLHSQDFIDDTKSLFDLQQKGSEPYAKSLRPRNPKCLQSEESELEQDHQEQPESINTELDYHTKRQNPRNHTIVQRENKELHQNDTFFNNQGKLSKNLYTFNTKVSTCCSSKPQTPSQVSFGGCYNNTSSPSPDISKSSCCSTDDTTQKHLLRTMVEPAFTIRPPMSCLGPIAKNQQGEAIRLVTCRCGDSCACIGCDAHPSSAMKEGKNDVYVGFNEAHARKLSISAITWPSPSSYQKNVLKPIHNIPETVLSENTLCDCGRTSRLEDCTDCLIKPMYSEYI